MSEIFDCLRRLPQFPHQGFRRLDFGLLPLRFAIIRDYLIAYVSEKEPLWVVAVIHGRRSPRVMAAILRGRE